MFDMLDNPKEFENTIMTIASQIEDLNKDYNSSKNFRESIEWEIKELKHRVQKLEITHENHGQMLLKRFRMYESAHNQMIDRIEKLEKGDSLSRAFAITEEGGA